MRKRKKKETVTHPENKSRAHIKQSTGATEHTQLRNGQEIRKHAQEYSKQTRDHITCRTAYVCTYAQKAVTPRGRDIAIADSVSV